MSSFVSRVLLGLVVLVASAATHAQTPLPPPNEAPLAQQRYVLRARLDPSTHEIHGEAEIHWTNTSRVPVSELWIHRYLEAFRHERTVFMRESGRQLRGVRFRGGGGLDVQALTLDEPSGPHDLLVGLDDPDDADDRTQLRVPLPRELSPGASITLRVRFVAKLPPVFARSGYHGDFHVAAQWFPKLARLEPDGTWATFPYHGFGEFYADFAEHDLTVDVPRGWDVVATGAETERSEHEGHVRVRFVQDRVHDCVFVAAPWLRRVEAEHRLDAHDGEHLTRVHLVHPPGYAHAAERHLEVTLAGLTHFGQIYGAYPYDDLTVVVPPRGADGAAGMEYPTLFLTAGPWLHVPGLPIALQDEVTAHELAHQWFQGLVATNEVQWPMLDEGITEWATGDLLESLHGRARSGIDVFGLRIDGFELRRALALRGGITPAPGNPVTAFRKSNDYGRAIYGRTAVVIETVARTWGRDRVHRALGHYARTQRFRHPRPDELFASFDREYGPWMSREVLRPALMLGGHSSVHASTPRIESGRTRVRLERRGVPLPRRVLLRGPDGARELDWPMAREVLELDEAGTWTSVWIDRDAHALLDPDRRDDARSTEPPELPSGLFARTLAFLQPLLQAVGP